MATSVVLAGSAAELAAAAPSGPSSSFGFANRCVAGFSAAANGFVTAAGTGYQAAGRAPNDAAPLYFKPTALGTYMIQDRDGKLLSVGDGAAVVRGSVPGPTAEWAPTRSGRGFFALRSTANGRWLAVDEATGNVDSAATADSSGQFRFTSRRGCLPYPEAPTGASGPVPKGLNPDGTVFGYADPHLHITADLRAGGQVLYGESFDRFGITQALGHDADTHGPDGSLDITGNLLRSGSPVGTHNTDGWPTFAGWPTFDTVTHQQVYYTWLQRAWLGGMRLVTAQLIEDQPLCEIEPRKSHSCDEVATIALEAQRLRGLQDYVDAQSGGPGRGWLRLVYDPQQARGVIEQGKLAVLIGVEASNPFGCGEFLNQSLCSRADVDRGIALYRQLGIRSLFVAHWVDNAFAGAALEGGNKGTFIGALQVAQTGLPFMTGPCPEPGQGSSCNSKGLTNLGEYLIGRLMDAHMLIEVDHLSEWARLRVLQMAEARHYPLVSSHTNTGGIWTPSDLQRLYALGGFATARPATAAKLAQSILSFQRYVPPGQFLGVGLGTDTGGFSTLPQPDPNAAGNPLHYPFRSYDGKVLFECQLAGPRTYNLNKDGVADYGLFADLLAYMRQQDGGDAASKLLFRSAEGYLRTWEAAIRS
jgi:microsomal dipeptidase-like Zn-dependent dipeptidase